MCKIIIRDFFVLRLPYLAASFVVTALAPPIWNVRDRIVLGHYRNALDAKYYDDKGSQPRKKGEGRWWAN